MELDLNELAKGFEKFREQRARMYSEYFENEIHLKRLVAKAGTIEGLTTSEEVEYFKHKRRAENLERITDILDQVWYGIFDQTDSGIHDVMHKYGVSHG